VEDVCAKCEWETVGLWGQYLLLYWKKAEEGDVLATSARWKKERERESGGRIAERVAGVIGRNLVDPSFTNFTCCEERGEGGG
jgi:hypothetical protein